MTDTNSTKKYPFAPPDVAKMLKISEDENLPFPSAEPTYKDIPVPGLPVAIQDAQEHISSSGLPKDGHFTKIAGNLYMKDGQDKIHERSNGAIHDGQAAQKDGSLAASSGGALVKGLKNVMPYVMVFSVAVFVYFFFFTKIDLGSALKTEIKPVTPKQSVLEQLESRNLDAYYAWVNQFYFDVSDPKVTDPDTDNSGNGLSNFQKYLLNLNPKTYDTLNLGMADSQTLAQGINPSTGTPLSDEQKAVVEKYFDMEVITNRLMLSNLNQQNAQATGQVAGSSVEYGIRGSKVNNPFQAQNGQPAVFQSAVQTQAVQSGALNANDLIIDQNIPGRLEIPSLKINVPVMWTNDPKDFDRDLQSGVVHYPGTALPGQIGTTYISGHSSNYAWAKGNYNRVFSTLGDLADNSSFKVTVVQKNGKDAILHYVVTGRKEYAATDQAQFQNLPKSVVAISTCWPIGTTQKRLVVFGELTQVEK